MIRKRHSDVEAFLEAKGREWARSMDEEAPDAACDATEERAGTLASPRRQPLPVEHALSGPL
jgi:hypothetical protein